MQNELKQLAEVVRPTRRTIICDVGANPLGEHIYQELVSADLCDVWGFEPQEEAFNRLVENSVAGQHYINAAIGSGGKATLNICNSSGFTSLLEPNSEAIALLQRWAKHMTVVEQVSLETTRLDEIEALPTPDLLKIDIQGSELAVFENGKNKLADTCCIITEVAFLPLYAGQPLVADQIATLSEMGFQLHRFLHLVHKPIGSRLRQKTNWKKHHNQLIDGDAVFIRKLMDLRQMPDENLKHLAICAAGVFQSQDIVLLCLDILHERGLLSAKPLQKYMDMIS